MSDCVFCEIMAQREPAVLVNAWPDAIAIVPINPVVAGHVLVIPRTHVEDYRTDPAVTAAVAARAASIAPWPSNLITSAGRVATQSVFHLHMHVVPRAADDGLALPWYSGKRSKTARA